MNDWIIEEKKTRRGFIPFARDLNCKIIEIYKLTNSENRMRFNILGYFQQCVYVKIEFR